MKVFIDTNVPEDERIPFEVRLGHDKAMVLSGSAMRAERCFTQGMGIRRSQHDFKVSEAKGFQCPADVTPVEIPKGPESTHAGDGVRRDPISGEKTNPDGTKVEENSGGDKPNPEGGDKPLTDAEKMAQGRGE